AVHKLTEFPMENVAIITAKGYSDSHKDGVAVDQEEAFKDAVENAARESGFTFTSETILSNLKLIKTQQKISIPERRLISTAGCFLQTINNGTVLMKNTKLISDNDFISKIFIITDLFIKFKSWRICHFDRSTDPD
ncbi:unnamed protein product, partial [marine sediment metagenome]